MIAEASRYRGAVAHVSGLMLAGAKISHFFETLTRFLTTREKIMMGRARERRGN